MPFSGRTHWSRRKVCQKPEELNISAHLVQFIAEVYRIDVVAFQIGKHDDLRNVY